MTQHPPQPSNTSTDRQPPIFKKPSLTLLLVGCFFVWLNVVQNRQQPLLPAEPSAGLQDTRALELQNQLQNENLALKTELEEARAALLKVIGQETQKLQKEDQTVLKEIQATKKEMEALKKLISGGPVKQLEAKVVQDTKQVTNDKQAEQEKNTTQAILPVPPEHCTPAWPSPPESTSQEMKKIWDLTVPFCNETTAALYTGIYIAGYRNQIMAFSALVMTALQDGHKQILLPTINHKDTYGSNRKNPHAALFDVAHWNSFYPQLPRMVHCDPNIMMDYNCSGGFLNPRHDMPHQYKTFKNQHFTAYQRYTRQKGPLAEPYPNPADVLIKSGALRPHPDMRAIRDTLLKKLQAPKDNYMALHPRVEPDMQRHPVCRQHKVTNLTNIVQFLESEWKEPPVQAVYITINREFLEREGILENYNKKSKKKKKQKGEEQLDTINWVAVNNLKELNRIHKEGLWGGKVKVFEIGTGALNGTKYANRMWSIGGSMLGFDTATAAKIFVGTEISSFSSDIVSSRFYQGNLENYYYRPDGLHRVTDQASTGPPAFGC